jgi:hypothetical protein
MAHEACNVDRCRDDAQAVADDLAGEKKSIHGRHPPRRRILVGLSSGRRLRPDRWRASLANDGRQHAGSAVKTRDETANRQSNQIFLPAGGQRRHAGRAVRREATLPHWGPAHHPRQTWTSSRSRAALSPRWHGSPQRKRDAWRQQASLHPCENDQSTCVPVTGGGPAVGSDTKAHNQRRQPLSHSDLNRTCIRPLAQSYC